MIIERALRAPSADHARAVMLRFGLLVDQGDGGLSPVEGLTVSDEIPIWQEPPVFDEESGALVSPGRRDPRYHCNLLAAPPATLRTGGDGVPVFDRLLDMWARLGSPGAAPNKAEVSVEFFGIEIIEPETINSKSHGFWR